MGFWSLILVVTFRVKKFQAGSFASLDGLVFHAGDTLHYKCTITYHWLVVDGLGSSLMPLRHASQYVRFIRQPNGKPDCWTNFPHQPGAMRPAQVFILGLFSIESFRFMVNTSLECTITSQWAIPHRWGASQQKSGAGRAYFDFHGT